MTKIIKIINDHDYKVLIDKEYIKLYNLYDVVIIYDRNERKIETLSNIDIYIVEKFVQLISEVEGDYNESSNSIKE